MQGQAAHQCQKHLKQTAFAVGDLLALLNTENHNLQLPSSQKSPCWIGPIKLIHLRGPNTVLIEVPPRLCCIEPIQNVEHLKAYVSCQPSIGPIPPVHLPDMIDDQEEH